MEELKKKESTQLKEADNADDDHVINDAHEGEFL